VEPEPLEVMIATIPLIVVTGLMVLAAVWVYRMSKLRELKQRQILAMIEKGITPPPELHPVAFNGAPRRSMQEERFKSGGIMLIGFGVALALVIGVAGGQARVGLGIGGAIAAIGAAMVVSALFSRGSGSVASGPPPEPRPAEPPRSPGGDDAVG
jgi:hypothetical protein